MKNYTAFFPTNKPKLHKRLKRHTAETPGSERERLLWDESENHSDCAQPWHRLLPLLSPLQQQRVCSAHAAQLTDVLFKGGLSAVEPVAMPPAWIWGKFLLTESLELQVRVLRCLWMKHQTNRRGEKKLFSPRQLHQSRKVSYPAVNCIFTNVTKTSLNPLIIISTLLKSVFLIGEDP